MARIVVGSYMVRYPLGGMMSYVLQYLRGFLRLGHEVYFVERASYRDACYDPRRDVMTDDCRYGIEVVAALLERFGLAGRWCFADVNGTYFGISRRDLSEVFASADLFLDMGTHGAWLDEDIGGVKVLLEGEPGFTQMRMLARLADGDELPSYDRYYTVGCNVGTGRSSAPTAGRAWGHLWHPIVIDDLIDLPLSPQGPFTTVMNWQSHQRIEHEGRSFGQKDLEFERFFDLPQRTALPLEVAVSGKRVPRQRLVDSGWGVRDAHEVTASYDSFWDYIGASRGEFSVCKHVFVATNSGWFSDRSAAYLAAGRPVVIEDTGFSHLIPTGRGLFAVRTAEEAAAALDTVASDLTAHSVWARELAAQHFAAEVLLGRFLSEVL